MRIRPTVIGQAEDDSASFSMPSSNKSKINSDLLDTTFALKEIVLFM